MVLFLYCIHIVELTSDRKKRLRHLLQFEVIGLMAAAKAHGILNYPARLPNADFTRHHHIPRVNLPSSLVRVSVGSHYPSNGIGVHSVEKGGRWKELQLLLKTEPVQLFTILNHSTNDDQNFSLLAR